MINSKIISAITFLLVANLFLLKNTIAGPFIESGDLQLRSDLQLLNDHEIINIPMSTWPMAWLDVIAVFDSSHNTPHKARVLQAMQRVKAKYRKEYRLNQVSSKIGISGGNTISTLRSFSSTPREEKQLHASSAWMNQGYAINVQVTAVDDPQDNKELRLDGSYASKNWGNWLLSAGAQERWWGPGWQGSLIMSNNARPVPGITLQRIESHAPETSWLEWIGPWSFMTFIGQMESERHIPGTKLWLARFTFKPFNSLEIGLSRAAQFGGDGRPEDLDTLWRMFLGKDNAGEGSITADNQPGNQLGGFDFRWNLPTEAFPSAFYLQIVGEDQSGITPTAKMRLFGLEHWGQYAAKDYRLYIEYADTAVYRSLDEPGFNVAYNHSVYQSGYRYFGRSLGHSMDNDGQVLTIGGTFAQSLYSSWQASISQARFNRDGTGSNNSVSPGTKTNYQDINVGQHLQIKNHAINWGLGYQKTEQPLLNNTNDDAYFYLDWAIDF